MPLSLSELLERIRPAGTPGAPTEGEEQRENFDRDFEIAEISSVLAAFEEEANALVAAATTRATEMGRDAERQAHQIRASVPDRIATVQAAAVSKYRMEDEVAQLQLKDQTAAEVTRLKSRADDLIPTLVGAATDAVWASVGLKAPSKDTQ